MMKQEEKDLLSKELCARLPYNLMVEYKGETYNVLGITHGRLVLCKPFMSYTLDEHPLVQEVKPYLFPLSSMTEEQMDKVEEILMSYDPKIIFDFMADGDIIFKKGNISIKAFMELTQYFDKEMLDYRGLIHMGLAVNASGLNIY